MLGHYGWNTDINMFQGHTSFLLQTGPSDTRWGLLNIGPGPFDGLHPDRFVGSANGTLIAVNTGRDFSGNVLDVQDPQAGGASLLIIDNFGNFQSPQGLFYIQTANCQAPISPWTFNFSDGHGLSDSSGTNNGLTVQPTIMQTGTAGYTALLVRCGETTTGSGTKRLLDLTLNDVSQFSVSNAGAVAMTGPITSYNNSTPANGQLLIGNTTNSNFSLATLSAGNGVTITNGAGTISIAATSSSAASSIYAVLHYR